MRLLLLILAGIDGGMGSTPRSVIDLFLLPKWGVSEEQARLRWPNLRLVRTDTPVGRALSYWTEQKLDAPLSGVALDWVRPYFSQKQGLEKVAFVFAMDDHTLALADDEPARRESLARLVTSVMGKPKAEGACYAIWEGPEAQVILETATLTLVAPGKSLPHVDVDCVRLRPIPVTKPSRPSSP
jgi:hypothetical protein